MPTLPTLPRGSTLVPGVVNISQPNPVGSGCGGSGGSSSSSSTTTISSTLTKSSGIPSIPAYHALGAARHFQPVVNSNNVSVDKWAHDKYTKKFVRSVPLDVKELKEIELIVLKTACGKVGSKEHLMYQKLATEAIDNKFGVPSHLITDRGGAEEGDQTKHLFIQQQYVDN